MEVLDILRTLQSTIENTDNRGLEVALEKGNECEYCSTEGVCIYDILTNEFKIKYNSSSDETRQAVLDLLKKEINISRLSPCCNAACALGEMLKLTPEKIFQYIIGYDSVTQDNGIGFCPAMRNCEVSKDISLIPINVSYNLDNE